MHRLICLCIIYIISDNVTHVKIYLSDIFISKQELYCPSRLVLFISHLRFIHSIIYFETWPSAGGFIFSLFISNYLDFHKNHFQNSCYICEKKNLRLFVSFQESSLQQNKYNCRWICCFH